MTHAPSRYLGKSPAQTLLTSFIHFTHHFPKDASFLRAATALCSIFYHLSPSLRQVQATSIMAPSHGLRPQPDISNSTSIPAATIKHIAEDNPTEFAEATGRFLTQMIKCYITTPLSWAISGSFIMTAAIIIVSVIFLKKLLRSTTRGLRRQNQAQTSYRQLRKVEVQRDREEQLEREEAEWQTRKDEVIRDRPNDVESLEYISGHPEEF